MDLRRTSTTLLTLACSALLVIGGMGCSRNPQNAAASGKKIDLTLPKPAARAQIPQKQAAKIEAAAKGPEAAVAEEQKEVNASRSTVKSDLTKSKAGAASVSAGKIKNQVRRKTFKQRAAVANGQQQRGPVGDGVPVKEHQDSPSSEADGVYQRSDNPLHPSYKKK